MEGKEVRLLANPNRLSGSSVDGNSAAPQKNETVEIEQALSGVSLQSDAIILRAPAKAVEATEELSAAAEAMEFLKTALNTQQEARLPILKYGQQCTKLMNDPTQTRLEFPNINNSFHRLILHKIGDYFGLSHTNIFCPSGTPILVIEKTPSSNLPEISLMKLIEKVDQDNQAPEAPKMKIMARRSGKEGVSQTGKSDKSVHAAAVSASRGGQSLEEREVEYARLRAKIFDNDNTNLSPVLAAAAPKANSKAAQLLEKFIPGSTQAVDFGSDQAAATKRGARVMKRSEDTSESHLFNRRLYQKPPVQPFAPTDYSEYSRNPGHSNHYSGAAVGGDFGSSGIGFMGVPMGGAPQGMHGNLQFAQQHMFRNQFAPPHHQQAHNFPSSQQQQHLQQPQEQYGNHQGGAYPYRSPVATQSTMHTPFHPNLHLNNNSSQFTPFFQTGQQPQQHMQHQNMYSQRRDDTSWQQQQTYHQQHHQHQQQQLQQLQQPQSYHQPFQPRGDFDSSLWSPPNQPATKSQPIASGSFYGTAGNHADQEHRRQKHQGQGANVPVLDMDAFPPLSSSSSSTTPASFQKPSFGGLYANSDKQRNDQSKHI
mmetsp:Transcript_10600/g.20090  ORF Transcript_10600/g.20090 Transcript_10600/m.20090 type:complete len:594 (-) Transcript_10600:43-1824(-)